MIDKAVMDIAKTLNILCVDDEEIILEIYKQLFSLLFNNVYFAKDGLEAYEQVCDTHKKIDIIFTDFMMPKCNGLEFSKKVRELDYAIPIVMVTALENIDVLRGAISINITGFLKKPIEQKSLFSIIERVVKTVIADKILQQEKEKKILYSDYQEKLTLKKEKTIIKNDVEDEGVLFDFTCDTLFKPLDTLSGDSYSIRHLSDGGYFLFLVDGMGKGISASTSAMLANSFVNHYINRSQKEEQSFDFSRLMDEFFLYITPNLLDDEALCCSFFYIKSPLECLYAIYAMPPVLYEIDGQYFKLRCNNLPLNNYMDSYAIDKFEEFEMVSKFLIYSDGLNENTLKGKEGRMYGSASLLDDFKKVENLSELYTQMMQKIETIEDDITCILLKKVKK